MSLVTITLARARSISDALADVRIAAVEPLPCGEARELPLEAGWKQWDLAVAIGDAEPAMKNTLIRAAFIASQRRFDSHFCELS